MKNLASWVTALVLAASAWAQPPERFRQAMVGLQSVQASVRLQAIQDLGRAGGPALALAMPALKEHLRDSSPTVREACLRIFLVRAHRAALLRAELKEILGHDELDHNRQMAAAILSELPLEPAEVSATWQAAHSAMQESYIALAVHDLYRRYPSRARLRQLIQDFDEPERIATASWTLRDAGQHEALRYCLARALQRPLTAEFALQELERGAIDELLPRLRVPLLKLASAGNGRALYLLAKHPDRQVASLIESRLAQHDPAALPAFQRAYAHWPAFKYRLVSLVRDSSKGGQSLKWLGSVASRDVDDNLRRAVAQAGGLDSLLFLKRVGCAPGTRFPDPANLSSAELVVLAAIQNDSLELRAQALERGERFPDDGFVLSHVLEELPPERAQTMAWRELLRPRGAYSAALYLTRRKTFAEAEVLLAPALSHDDPNICFSAWRVLIGRDSVAAWNKAQPLLFQEPPTSLENALRREFQWHLPAGVYRPHYTLEESLARSDAHALAPALRDAYNRSKLGRAHFPAILRLMREGDLNDPETYDLLVRLQDQFAAIPVPDFKRMLPLGHGGSARAAIWIAKHAPQEVDDATLNALIWALGGPDPKETYDPAASNPQWVALACYRLDQKALPTLAALRELMVWGRDPQARYVAAAAVLKLSPRDKRAEDCLRSGQYAAYELLVNSGEELSHLVLDSMLRAGHQLGVPTWELAQVARKHPSRTVRVKAWTVLRELPAN